MVFFDFLNNSYIENFYKNTAFNSLKNILTENEEVEVLIEEKNIA